MKDIIIGISLLFLIPSMVQFWVWFLYLEKTRQIILPDDYNECLYVIFKKRRYKK